MQNYTTQELKWMGDTIMVLGVKIVPKRVIEKNYCSAINHLEIVMNNIWNKRGLSLMVKILIINFLMISFFTYKMQVLPLLPLEICN